MKFIVFVALLAYATAAPSEVSLDELISDTEKNIDEFTSVQGSFHQILLISTYSWKLVDTVYVYTSKVSNEANPKNSKLNELWTTTNNNLSKLVYQVFDHAAVDDHSPEKPQQQFIEALRSCIKEATSTAESAQESSRNFDQEIAGHAKEILAIALQIIKSLNAELKGEPAEHSSKE